MTLQEHLRRTFTLAWPVMLGQLGHVMVGLADSIMIGQLGTIPLAAGAFANSIFIIPMVFGIGMAMGMTTPISNAEGEGKPEKAGSYLKHGLVLHMLVAVLIFFGLLGLLPFLSMMGQEPEVVELATPYLSILTSSIFPFLLFLTYKQFAEGLSDTRFAMMASIGANLVNIFLNYLLIYGNWGFPELGLNGAAYATLTARVLMAISMFWYVRKTSKFQSYLEGFKQLVWSKSQFKRLLNIGIPSGMQYIFEVSAFAVAAIIAGKISAEALASHQIAISLASLSYMMASGLGAAAAVRVGNQLGARNYKLMRDAGRACAVMTIAFMIVCGIIFFAGRNYFPTFYTDDLSVMNIASQLLVIAVVFQISDGVQAVMLGALRGMSEVKIPTLFTLISYWGLGLFPAYALGIWFELGAKGIWYGLAIGLTAASILLYWRFEYRSKKLILKYG